MNLPHAFLQPMTVICSWLLCHIRYTFFNPHGASTTFTKSAFPSSGNLLSSIFIVSLGLFSVAGPSTFSKILPCLSEPYLNSCFSYLGLTVDKSVVHVLLLMDAASGIHAASLVPAYHL